MKGRMFKAATALGVVGAVLVILVLICGGTSSVFTPKISTAEELEKCGSYGGGIYRPFAEVEFDEVTFSGLYLTEERDGADRAAAWVMWGSNDETTVCFFVKADGTDLDGDGSFDDGDAPADEENVSYILRGAQPSYDEHSQWALDESVSDVADFFSGYGVTEDDIRVMFADTVLEASRQGRLIARVGIGAGALMLIAGAVLWIIDRRRRKDEPEPEDEETIANEPEDTIAEDEETIANEAEDALTEDEETIAEEPEDTIANEAEDALTEEAEDGNV